MSVKGLFKTFPSGLCHSRPTTELRSRPRRAPAEMGLIPGLTSVPTSSRQGGRGRAGQVVPLAPKSSVPTTMATRWTRPPTEVPFRVGADSWAWAGQGRATWEGKLLLGDKSSAACAGFGTRRRARQIVLRATPRVPADYGAMPAAAAALGPGQVAVELAGDVAL